MTFDTWFNANGELVEGMTKFGYGGPEEVLYLRAYELAKSGAPTLLFSFESSEQKLTKILISHTMRVSMIELDNDTEVLKARMKEFSDAHTEHLPLVCVDTASMPIEEIEEKIKRNKEAKNITHVVFDRADDPAALDQIGVQYGVKIIH
jgi:KaiC/GvpD/RAD55 family RecA-like ATPase